MCGKLFLPENNQDLQIEISGEKMDVNGSVYHQGSITTKEGCISLQLKNPLYILTELNENSKEIYNMRYDGKKTYSPITTQDVTGELNLKSNKGSAFIIYKN